MYWSTLYSKREDRDQRLSLPEGYAKKYSQADRKRRRCIASNERSYFLIFPKIKLRRETFEMIAIVNSG